MAAAVRLLAAARARNSSSMGLSLSQQTSGYGTTSSSSTWLDECKAIMSDHGHDILELFGQVEAGDVHDLAKAIDLALTSDAELGADLWTKLVKEVISDPEWTSGRKGLEIVHTVINKIDELPEQRCADTVEFLLDSIGQCHSNFAKCLELLPKLLSKVAKAQQIESRRQTSSGMAARVTRFSGEEYKKEVISEICRLEWPRAVIVPLVTVLRELNLHDDQLDAVVGLDLDLLYS
eukprot:767407-Hanusia_phi.AAC.3